MGVYGTAYAGGGGAARALRVRLGAIRTEHFLCLAIHGAQLWLGDAMTAAGLAQACKALGQRALALTAGAPMRERQQIRSTAPAQPRAAERPSPRARLPGRLRIEHLLHGGQLAAAQLARVAQAWIVQDLRVSSKQTSEPEAARTL